MSLTQVLPDSVNTSVDFTFTGNVIISGAGAVVVSSNTPLVFANGYPVLFSDIANTTANFAAVANAAYTALGITDGANINVNNMSVNGYFMANNSTGTAGQILTSNGSNGVYWTDVYGYFGSTGYTGSQGNQGFTGSQGSGGLPGVDGYTGSQGDIGYTGSAGIGYAGSAGSAGYVGSKGAIGLGASSYDFFYSTDVSNSAIANTYLKFSNADITFANTLIVSKRAGTNFSYDINTYFYYVSSRVSSIKGDISVYYQDDPSFFTNFNITGPLTDFGDYVSFPISYITGSANNYTANVVVVLGFTVSGDTGYVGSIGSTGYVGSQGIQGNIGYVGSKGDIGFTGSQGPAGTFGGASFNYNYSTNTTHTSTPDGYLNFSNTNLASANALYIDYIDALGANSYSFLQTIDDSTSSIKGHFSIRDVANSLNYAMFSIVGTHTEETDHFNVPISYLSGVTSFTNGTNTLITFARTGDIGDTGYTGSQGSVGYVGSLGFTGSIGYSGSRGDAGYAGSLGFTGSKGDTGFAGSKGDLGYTGSVGPNAGIENQLLYKDSSNTLVGSSNLTFNGSTFSVNGFIESTYAAGDEGGEIHLAKPLTNSTISGTVNIDIYQNKLRIFESSGSNRGAYIDLTSAATGVGSNLLAASTAGYTGSKGDLGYTGSIGFTGSQGSQGTTGFTGSKGDQGTQGYTGSKGDQGTQGYTGSKGDIGFTGSQGPEGQYGPTGYTGSKGDIGYVGSQGNLGYAGSAGFTGSSGYTGSIGDIGYSGSQGVAGYAGSQGNLGYSGSQGDLGYTGSRGDLGYTGSFGSTGYTGSFGSTGFTGSQGPAGTFGGAAFNYNYSTNTSHTSTPDGYLNFSNTNLASANALYIDYIDALGANSYSFLQTIDDSTSSIKGHFSVKDTSNSLNYAMFSIIGTHTEETDHFNVPISYLSGVTSFTNGTNVVITFARTGDIGDTGYTGSIGYTGSGFANGQSLSVNNFVITGTLTVNNSVGTAGQVLASNGTGVYWTTDQISNNITTYVITANTLNSDYINIGVGRLSVGNSTVNTTISNSGIRVSNTTSNVVLTLTDFRVPVGNTAQRPANATTGFIRFNTDTTDLEYAGNSTTWYSITTQETLTSNNINITNLVSIGNSTVNTVITSSSVRTTTANVNVINATGNVFITGNNAIFKVPVGTTAQRPSPAATGYVRFNTDTTDLEYAANATQWYSITTQETLTSNNISVNNNITVGNSTVNTTISSTNVTTSYVNTRYVVANGSIGANGSVLTSNGTGIFWSNAVSTLTATSLVANSLVADTIDIGVGWLTVGNGTVNTLITNTSITTSIASIQTAYFTSDLTTPFTTYTTALDATTPKSVNFAGVALNSAAGVGYTVEFFVKFNSLSTGAGDAYGATGVNQLGWSANTSTISLYNAGYTNAGNYTGLSLQNGVWYHIAYIGFNGGTYLAVNGVVKNLNTPGGYSGYFSTGTWAGGWTKLTGNASFSNFRVLTGRNIYSINGFSPPTQQLTAISGTQLLTLQSSTFVDRSGYSRSVTTSGSPTLSVDIISLSTATLTVAGSIQNGILNTPQIYTNYIYANNTLGTTGQVLGANSTGGIYWTTDQVSSTVTANVITTTSLAAQAITVDVGDITVGSAAANSFISNNYIAVSNSSGYSANISTSSIKIGNSVSNSVITSTSIKTTTVNAVSIYANSSYGTAGQYLTSNGTGIYWSTVSGTTGYTGSIGYTGSTGYTGSVGYVGSVGYTGSTGAGYTGSQGSQGSLGYTGSIGYAGSQGANSLYTISSTAPSSPTAGDRWFHSDYGIELVYTYDGNSYQWVEIAASGFIGYVGSAGYTGSLGYTGSIGYTGSKGDTGFTGSFGYTGSQPGAMTMNTQSTSYSLVATDDTKLVSTSSNVIVNPSVFTTNGATVSVYNSSTTSSITIVQNTVTMYLAGTTTTGNRTLATQGIASVICVDSINNTFVITGSGLS